MKKHLSLYIVMLFVTSLLISCSSTTLTGSWRNPDYQAKVDTIYIVGVSKQETHRRIFEDEFGRELKKYHIKTVSSYRDLNNAQNAELDDILAKVKDNNAGALLLTRILDRRTEQVVNPGRVTEYRPGPVYYEPGGYYPRPYYRNYRDYYDRRYEMIYEPATITKFKVITVESNLYDANSGELIWSAQLETVMEGTMQSMIRDFIEVVIKDLIDKGVI